MAFPTSGHCPRCEMQSGDTDVNALGMFETQLRCHLGPSLAFSKITGREVITGHHPRTFQLQNKSRTGFDVKLDYPTAIGKPRKASEPGSSDNVKSVISLFRWLMEHCALGLNSRPCVVNITSPKPARVNVCNIRCLMVDGTKRNADGDDRASIIAGRAQSQRGFQHVKGHQVTKGDCRLGRTTRVHSPYVISDVFAFSKLDASRNVLQAPFRPASLTGLGKRSGSLGRHRCGID